MSEVNQLNTRPAARRIPLYGGILGLVLCLLISSVCGVSYFSVIEGFPIKGIQDLGLILDWLVILGIFAGPFGAAAGAFVATDLFMTDEAGKKVARTLFRVCGAMLGFILGFWMATLAIFRLYVQKDGELMVLGMMYSFVIGPIIGFLGAAAGVSVAKHLLEAWSPEEH